MPGRSFLLPLKTATSTEWGELHIISAFTCHTAKPSCCKAECVPTWEMRTAGESTNPYSKQTTTIWQSGDLGQPSEPTLNRRATCACAPRERALKPESFRARLSSDTEMSPVLKTLQAAQLALWGALLNASMDKFRDKQGPYSSKRQPKLLSVSICVKMFLTLSRYCASPRSRVQAGT